MALLFMLQMPLWHLECSLLTFCVLVERLTLHHFFATSMTGPERVARKAANALTSCSDRRIGLRSE
jgi:hypothetical protein